MKHVALVGDTHIPERAERIPDGFRGRIRGADHVIHTGDFTSADALETVEVPAENLTAVYGNMDPQSLDLPAVATVEVESVEFVVTHGTGSPRDYEERVTGVAIDAAGDDAIAVAGHRHEVLDTTVTGIRLLNPGSATGAAPAERATMMTVEVDDGAIDVAIHEG